MSRAVSVRTALVFLLDAILLIICLENIPHVINRPGVPFDVAGIDGRVVVSALVDSSASGGIKVGDDVVRWDDLDVRLPEVLEFLADLQTIGDEIPIEVLRGGEVEIHRVRLIPFYQTIRFVTVTVVVGVISWLVGMFVLMRGSRTLAGRTLHASLITFAIVVLVTLGSVSAGHVPTLVSRFLFIMSYLTVVPIFFFFTLLYPVEKGGSIMMKALLTFAPVVLLLVPMEYYYMRALYFTDVESFQSFQSLFDVLQASLFVYLAASTVSVVHTLRSVKAIEDRRRIQWVIGGVLVGAVPYLMMHVLPQLIWSQYLISEEFGTMFFIAVPFAFAISFFRYRFLDIEMVVNRGLVYIVLSILVLVIYGMFVLMISSLVGGTAVFREYIYVTLATLTIALLFEPIRARVQIIVDETFFPTRVHFRKTFQEISADLHRALSGSELYSKLVAAVRDRFPVECIAGYRFRDDVLIREAAHGREVPSRIALSEAQLDSLVRLDAHVADKTTKLDAHRASQVLNPWLKKLGYPVVLTIRSAKPNLMGVIFLCPRSLRDMFREEEIDLFRSVCREASDILERLALQERMILEAEERRRLEELSNLKSDFVSYVSHEFRSPLAAIKMFSELMEQQKSGRTSKGKEYLDIIKGESDRLNRIVNNILDSAKIEGKVKQYTFECLEFRDIVRESLKIMDYQLRKHEFRVVFSSGRRPMRTSVDREAMILVFTNLIGNAIKYSGSRKYLRLTMQSRKGWVGCEVLDRGVGISREAIPNIFSKYYRDDSSPYKVDGVGLGLSLVKYVVDAHGGKITVESERGKGTAVTVWLREKSSREALLRRKKTKPSR